MLQGKVNGIKGLESSINNGLSKVPSLMTHYISLSLINLPVVSGLPQVQTVNTYNAAGVSRRQDQNITNLVKNDNILEFGYYIQNPYEKCIQKSPNMPGIGSLIREIDVNISEI